MYKVLIADDENLIRITLKNMIDWKSLNCEVIALAKDGEEAYRIYEEVHPEIVITDLKMPKMDGIELISKIRKENNNTQVIALSNYSDFELVRDAMKAGAFDYLLKITLEEKELEEIIRQVKQNCEANTLTMDEEEDQALLQLRQSMLMIKNEHVMEEDKFLKALNQPIFQPYYKDYQMAYFRVDNVDVVYETKIKDHAKMKNNLQDLIRETIPLGMPYLMIFLSNHSGVLLFHGEEKIRVLNICNSMIRNISQYMDIALSITVSPKENDVTSFYQTYLDILASHDKRFYEGEGTLMFSEENFEFEELSMNDISFHTDILTAVQEKDFAQVNRVVNEALHFMKIQRMDPYSVKEYFIFILNNIEGNEIAKGIKEAYPFDALHRYIHISETFDKLKEQVETAFEEICKWMWSEGSDKYKKNIMEIISFIEEHLTEKVTLKMIAEAFGMSESYLSRVFKNETGMNLIGFINDRKMKKAKELLEDESFMIKDVAMQVGIDDQFYFNKVFKKVYGMSPSEYRKKLSQHALELSGNKEV